MYRVCLISDNKHIYIDKLIYPVVMRASVYLMGTSNYIYIHKLIYSKISLLYNVSYNYYSPNRQCLSCCLDNLLSNIRECQLMSSKIL